jgi:putative FmdB family regulatory protein
VPIYEFRCPNGHLFEVFHRITDPDPDVCEVCGAAPLTKVLHPVPIHFKGSGFYSTDYGRRKKAGSESKSEGSSDGKSSEKSEKKSSEGGSSEPKKAAEA